VWSAVEEYTLDLTIRTDDALAWREVRDGKKYIVVNVAWLNIDVERIAYEIHRAVVHEILHEVMGTECEEVVNTAEKLLLG